MNKKMKLIERAKNSCVGKVIRRVMGEETGAVMMEYVIIAVLIAAAVAVGVWYFGRTINNEMRVASHGMAGDDEKAQEMQKKSQENIEKQDEAARNAQKEYIKTSNETAADL